MCDYSVIGWLQALRFSVEEYDALAAPAISRRPSRAPDLQDFPEFQPEAVALDPGSDEFFYETHCDAKLETQFCHCKMSQKSNEKTEKSINKNPSLMSQNECVDENNLNKKDQICDKNQLIEESRKLYENLKLEKPSPNQRRRILKKAADEENLASNQRHEVPKPSGIKVVSQEKTNSNKQNIETKNTVDFQETGLSTENMVKVVDESYNFLNDETLQPQKISCQSGRNEFIADLKSNAVAKNTRIYQNISEIRKLINNAEFGEKVGQNLEQQKQLVKEDDTINSQQRNKKKQREKVSKDKQDGLRIYQNIFELTKDKDACQNVDKFDIKNKETSLKLESVEKGDRKKNRESKYINQFDKEVKLDNSQFTESESNKICFGEVKTSKDNKEKAACQNVDKFDIKNKETSLKLESVEKDDRKKNRESKYINQFDQEVKLDNSQFKESESNKICFGEVKTSKESRFYQNVQQLNKSNPDCYNHEDSSKDKERKENPHQLISDSENATPDERINDGTKIYQNIQQISLISQNYQKRKHQDQNPKIINQNEEIRNTEVISLKEEKQHQNHKSEISFQFQEETQDYYSPISYQQYIQENEEKAKNINVNKKPNECQNTKELREKSDRINSSKTMEMHQHQEYKFQQENLVNEENKKYREEDISNFYVKHLHQQEDHQFLEKMGKVDSGQVLDVRKKDNKEILSDALKQESRYIEYNIYLTDQLEESSNEEINKLCNKEYDNTNFKHICTCQQKKLNIQEDASKKITKKDPLQKFIFDETQENFTPKQDTHTYVNLSNLKLRKHEEAKIVSEDNKQFVQSVKEVNYQEPVKIRKDKSSNLKLHKHEETKIVSEDNKQFVQSEKEDIYQEPVKIRKDKSHQYEENINRKVSKSVNRLSDVRNEENIIYENIEAIRRCHSYNENLILANQSLKELKPCEKVDKRKFGKVEYIELDFSEHIKSKNHEEVLAKQTTHEKDSTSDYAEIDFKMLKTDDKNMPKSQEKKKEERIYENLPILNQTRNTKDSKQNSDKDDNERARIYQNLPVTKKDNNERKTQSLDENILKTIQEDNYRKEREQIYQNLPVKANKSKNDDNKLVKFKNGTINKGASKGFTTKFSSFENEEMDVFVETKSIAGVAKYQLKNSGNKTAYNCHKNKDENRVEVGNINLKADGGKKNDGLTSSIEPIEAIRSTLRGSEKETKEIQNIPELSHKAIIASKLCLRSEPNAADLKDTRLSECVTHTGTADKGVDTKLSENDDSRQVSKSKREGSVDNRVSDRHSVHKRVLNAPPEVTECDCCVHDNDNNESGWERHTPCCHQVCSQCVASRLEPIAAKSSHTKENVNARNLQTIGDSACAVLSEKCEQAADMDAKLAGAEEVSDKHAVDTYEETSSPSLMKSSPPQCDNIKTEIENHEQLKEEIKCKNIYVNIEEIKRAVKNNSTKEEEKCNPCDDVRKSVVMLEKSLHGDDEDLLIEDKSIFDNLHNKDQIKSSVSRSESLTYEDVDKFDDGKEKEEEKNSGVKLRRRVGAGSLASSETAQLGEESEVVLRKKKHRHSSFVCREHVICDNVPMNIQAAYVRASLSNRKSSHSPYQHIWECSSKFAMHFGDVRPVSTFIEETIDDLPSQPIVLGRFDYTIPDSVVQWVAGLTLQCDDEEDEEFQTSLEHIQEHRKTPPFPPPTPDDLVLRRTLERRNAVARSQTIHVPPGHTLPSLKKENAFPKEIKGVYKIKIGGDEWSAKGQVVKIENGSLMLVDEKNGKVTVVKKNFLVDSHRMKDEKKLMEIKTLDGTVELKFNHSKDTEQFSPRKRANSESRPPDSPSDEKRKTRNLLMKFLKRRSSKEVLVRKGILKNEPIFGNTLNCLWESYEVTVPHFITKVIEIIERPYNITSLGIYRASGNLATIQKIRFNVDKNNLKILEEFKKDTDVLTGCLKMFFRELTQPLIPMDAYDRLLEMAEQKWSNEYPDRVRPIIENMDRPHKDTLKTLMVHLLKVIDNQEENKMSMQNMSIVWGPSLIHVPDSTGENLIKNSNNANSVIFLLLKCFQVFQTPSEEPESHDCSPVSDEENILPPKATEEVYHSLEDLTKAQTQNNYKEKWEQISQKISNVQWLQDGNPKPPMYASNMSIASSVSTEGGYLRKGISCFDLNGKIRLIDLPQSSKSKIPKFFVKIVELIEKHLKSRNLYVPPDKNEKVEKIKSKIREGRPYSLSKIKGSPSELTQLLLDFIDEIVEPLLPSEYVEPFIIDFETVNDKQRQLDIHILIERLDTVHRETIEFLMKHLNIVVDCQEHNNMTKEKICEIFAPRFFSFCPGDPKKIIYEKIFESVFNVYVSHTPSPELLKSSFGSSRSLFTKNKEAESPKLPTPRFKSSGMKEKWKRLSKFNNVKSVYDNLPVHEGIYVQNEATFLDDNT